MAQPCKYAAILDTDSTMTDVIAKPSFLLNSQLWTDLIDSLIAKYATILNWYLWWSKWRDNSYLTTFRIVYDGPRLLSLKLLAVLR